MVEDGIIAEDRAELPIIYRPRIMEVVGKLPRTIDSKKGCLEEPRNCEVDKNDDISAIGTICWSIDHGCNKEHEKVESELIRKKDREIAELRKALSKKLEEEKKEMEVQENKNASEELKKLRSVARRSNGRIAGGKVNEPKALDSKRKNENDSEEDSDEESVGAMLKIAELQKKKQKETGGNILEKNEEKKGKTTSNIKRKKKKQKKKEIENMSESETSNEEEESKKKANEEWEIAPDEEAKYFEENTKPLIQVENEWVEAVVNMRKLKNKEPEFLILFNSMERLWSPLIHAVEDCKEEVINYLKERRLYKKYKPMVDHPKGINEKKKAQPKRTKK